MEPRGARALAGGSGIRWHPLALPEERRNPSPKLRFYLDNPR
jgi:hypothetical protein